jgi:hypothetical protein
MTTSPPSPPANWPAETFSPANTPPTKRRRWLPRLNLRTALLLMLILGAGLGVGGNFWRKVHRQRQIVSAIEGAGGYIQYGYELGSGPEVKYKFSIDRHPAEHFYTNPPAGPFVIGGERAGTPPGPQFLRRIFGDQTFSTIEALYLDSRSSTKEPNPQILRGLNDLRFAYVGNRFICDESIRIVSQLPHLRCLVLDGNEGRISDANLLLLKEAGQLEGLHLSGRWVTDDVMRNVAQVNQLKYFSLTAAPNVTSEGLKSLAGLKRLEALDLTEIEGCSTKFLSELTELKSLFVHQVVPFEFEPLKNLRKLQKLIFWNKMRTRPDLKCLEGLSELQVLHLNYTDLEDGDLDSLPRLPMLRDLMLKSSEVNDKGLATIAKLAQLQKLNLEADKATDAGIRKLKSLNNVRWLQVRGNISAETVTVLDAELPNCTLRLRNVAGEQLAPSP